MGRGNTLGQLLLKGIEGEASSPAIERLIELMGQRETTEEKILAALQFVQDKIRYLGMEMGIHAFAPHPRRRFSQRRYGDCKDKSLLLQYLLHKMNIPSSQL